MLARRRGELAVIVALVAMVAVEAFALRASTLGIVVIGVLAGLALVIIVSQADLARIGVGAAVACAFTLTWNGWFVGPVRPGDVLILVTLMCFTLAVPTAFRSLPWWIKQLVLGLAVLVVLLVLLPPDSGYLAQRTVLDAGGGAVPQHAGSVSVKNIAIAAKFFVAVAITPLVFAAAVHIDRRSLRRLAIAFTVGAALSGFAAFVDHLHVASIGRLITGLPNIGDRQVGFANHPNFLAAALVVAIPFACWLLVSPQRRQDRGIGAISLVSMVLGVYASGSRGGAVCALAAVVAAFSFLPRTRASLPGILLLGTAATGVVAAVFPNIGLAILRGTRLLGNPTTAGSDIVRARVKAQGLADFRESPIKGIGLQASTDASHVYIQELASGGRILFALMTVYMLGAAWAAWTRIAETPLAAAILASVVATLALNFLEADLTERFYYVPEAILVALIATARRGRPAGPAVLGRASSSSQRSTTPTEVRS